MKYLKLFENFDDNKVVVVSESHNKSVHISDSEMNLFSDEAALQELITKNKITLKNGEVLYDENDEETRDLLDQYLEMPGKA